MFNLKNQNLDLTTSKFWLESNILSLQYQSLDLNTKIVINLTFFLPKTWKMFHLKTQKKQNCDKFWLETKILTLQYQSFNLKTKIVINFDIFLPKTWKMFHLKTQKTKIVINFDLKLKCSTWKTKILTLQHQNFDFQTRIVINFDLISEIMINFAFKTKMFTFF